MNCIKKIIKINLLLTVIFLVTINFVYIVKAEEFTKTDIQYEADYEDSTYYLTGNGDLFVSFNYKDAPRPLRLATGVRKIEYDNYHRILYVIKNDKSLWVRGYNIYLRDVNDSSFWELTKIDDDVEDIFFSDSESHYWLYKKTDNSLWLVGNYGKPEQNTLNDGAVRLIKTEKRNSL